jgi:hypothetical protein
MSRNVRFALLVLAMTVAVVICIVRVWGVPNAHVVRSALLIVNVQMKCVHVTAGTV